MMVGKEFIRCIQVKATNGGMNDIPDDVDNKLILLAICDLAEEIGHVKTDISGMACARPADDPMNPLVRIDRVERWLKIMGWTLTVLIAPVGVWAAIAIISEVAKAVTGHM